MRRKKDRKGARPNIEDVAREAGVSISTVSRVMNNPGQVKGGNRSRVEDAIKKLNFRPDAAARRLAGNQPTTVTLVIPYYENLFDSFYILEVIRGAGSAAVALKLDLLVHVADHSRMDESLDCITDMRISQGLIFSDIESIEPVLDRAIAENVPAVVLNNYLKDMPVSCLDVDNKNGAISAIDHLAGLGHKRIATITGRLTVESGNARLEGYREGLAKHGIKVREDYIESGDFRPQTGYAAMKKLLGLKELPSAVFVASDEMASKAIEAIKDGGLSVPEDISIVGFDDHWIATYGEVMLTTIRQPMYELGVRAVRLLYELIKGERREPFKAYLPTQFIVRKSTRRII